MEFEEYWNSLASDPSDPETLVMQCRFAAENAWYAAMNIEREACAMVCEGKNPHPDEYSPDAEYVEKRTALACAEAIRMRSNAS